MKCEPGCTCRRHVGYAVPCVPGCTCNKHGDFTERGRNISAAKKGKPLTHGLFGHPLYYTWTRMMARCYDPNYTNFKYWGGRGITVCDEWHDITVFIQWMESDAGIGLRPDGLSLDRIDNDGNYEPGNIRWATRSQQNLNRRPRRSVGTVV